MFDEKFNWIGDRSTYIVQADIKCLVDIDAKTKGYLQTYARVPASELEKISKEPRKSNEPLNISINLHSQNFIKLKDEVLHAQILLAALVAERDDIHYGDTVWADTVWAWAGEHGRKHVLTSAGLKPMRHKDQQLLVPWELIHPDWPMYYWGNKIHDHVICANVSFAGCSWDISGDLHGLIMQISLRVGKSLWLGNLEPTPFAREYMQLLTCPQASPVSVKWETSHPMADPNNGEILFDIEEYKSWGPIYEALACPTKKTETTADSLPPLHEFMDMGRLADTKVFHEKEASLPFQNSNTNQLVSVAKEYVAHVANLLVELGLSAPVARLAALYC